MQQGYYKKQNNRDYKKWFWSVDPTYTSCLLECGVIVNNMHMILKEQTKVEVCATFYCRTEPLNFSAEKPK